MTRTEGKGIENENTMQGNEAERVTIRVTIGTL